MAYNHQQKYLRAIGTLYRNRGPGSPKPGGGKSQVAEGLEGVVNSGISFDQDNKDRLQKQRTMAQAIDTQTKTRDMGNAIMQQSMADAIMRAQMQDAIQRGIMQQAQDQMQRNRQAEATANAPVGGRFTGTGFQQHAKESSRQAADIDMSRRLMQHGNALGTGMGGSFPRPVEEL